MSEQRIIDTALERLKETTGIEGHFTIENPEDDGHIVLTVDNQELDFFVEVKREIRPHQIEQIRALNHHYANKLLVIAQKIYPRVKQELKELTIPFLEANGNLYLKRDGIWIWIDTNPPIKPGKDTSNRAFTKTGLKVLFHFFLKPELINQTHRHIAAATNVAVGNIPQIIDGLKRTGYIYPLNKDTYMWEDRRALFDRWITEYATTLRSSLLIKRYQAPDNWKNLDLKPEITLWGGEPAADLMTNHLRPEEFILYTKETEKDLIQKYRFKPDPDGKLFVYEMFWDDPLHREKFVPPELIYADLMIKGDKRCRETAKMIQDKLLEF